VLNKEVHIQCVCQVFSAFSAIFLPTTGNNIFHFNQECC